VYIIFLVLLLVIIGLASGALIYKLWEKIKLSKCILKLKNYNAMLNEKKMKYNDEKNKHLKKVDKVDKKMNKIEEIQRTDLRNLARTNVNYFYFLL
jgi:hypothetical protein